MTSTRSWRRLIAYAGKTRTPNTSGGIRSMYRDMFRPEKCLSYPCPSWWIGWGCW
jgi:hypothetical protein